jgi:hypothetical protein
MEELMDSGGVSGCSTFIYGRSLPGLGTALAVADLDGDGAVELLASEPGAGSEPDRIYALQAAEVAAAKTYDAAGAWVIWEAPAGHQLGASLLPAGSLWATASEQVWAGAPGVGRESVAEVGQVYMLEGASPGTYDAAESALVLQGNDKEENCGAALATSPSATSFLGGALPDLLVGCPGFGEGDGRVIAYVDLVIAH